MRLLPPNPLCAVCNGRGIVDAQNGRTAGYQSEYCDCRRGCNRCAPYWRKQCNAAKRPVGAPALMRFA